MYPVDFLRRNVSSAEIHRRFNNTYIPYFTAKGNIRIGKVVNADKEIFLVRLRTKNYEIPIERVITNWDTPIKDKRAFLFNGQLFWATILPTRQWRWGITNETFRITASNINPYPNDMPGIPQAYEILLNTHYKGAISPSNVKNKIELLSRNFVLMKTDMMKIKVFDARGMGVISIYPKERLVQILNPHLTELLKKEVNYDSLTGFRTP